MQCTSKSKLYQIISVRISQVWSINATLLRSNSAVRGDIQLVASNKQKMHTLLLFVALVHYARSVLFCSAYCSPNQCTGISNTQCSACDSPFTFSGGTCTINPTSSSYAIYADSSNITVAPNTNGACSVYNIKGPIASTGTFTLTAPAIPTAHFKIRLILWVVLYDEWKPQTDYVESRLTSTNQFYQFNVTFYQTAEKVCGTGAKFEWFIKSDYAFTHTDTTNPINFLITAQHTGGVLDWGIKDYMILSGGCYPSCSSCTDILQTTCTACKAGNKLSGTTCNTTCLAQYGSTNNPLVCVYCDLKCEVCYEISTNCSACTTSGVNEAFLLGSTCVNPCPAGYATNTASHICLACTDSACLSCDPANVSSCYACNSSTFWLEFACYSPCPASTFTAGSNCTRCDPACLTCTGAPSPCSLCNAGYALSGTVCASACLAQYGVTANPLVCVLCDALCSSCAFTSTNCSACTTSGVNEAFLLGTTCVNPCPASYLSDLVTHRCLLCSNPSCLSCSTTNRSICYSCDNTTVWFSSDCLSTCPVGFYRSGLNCTSCDISCAECTGNPSPCTVCSSSYYFLSSSCLSACPTGFFSHNVTMQCLDCSIDCVTATLSLSLQSKSKQLQIIIAFSRPVDFSMFPYSTFQSISFSDPSVTLNDFTVTYTLTSDRSYSITLTPASSSFTMANVVFNVSINNYRNASAPFHSSDGYLFSDSIYLLHDDITWTIAQNNDSSLSLEQVNDQINKFFEQEWVQEIKKTGVFAVLFPGAQLCSTIILHNATPPATMYEAARFWGSFIYFEVPKWEQDGSGLKRVFTSLISTLVNNQSSRRVLGPLASPIDWRLSRTGFTGYFLFDAYIPVLVIIVSWVPISILKLWSKWRSPAKIGSMLYTILHRAHEISMFYIMISLCLEWAYFPQHSVAPYKYLSFGSSILLVLYCLAYEIHCFYKIIPFPYTDLGSTKFDFYIQRYAYFLRDIRYQEYGRFTRWHCTHFLRPYNYRILSFFRLVLFLVSLVVFQEVVYGCISCLIVLQCLEIIRFLLSWPYSAKWRNLYMLSLQVALLVIFLLYLAGDIMYRNNQSNLDLQWKNLHTIVGWAGLILLFCYNVLFFVYFCIDIVIGCVYTNRQRMESARNCYYRFMLEEFEAYRDSQNPTFMENSAKSYFEMLKNSHKNGYFSLLDALHETEPAIQPGESEKQIVKQLTIKGNLCGHDYDKYWKIKVKIEQYEIRETGEAKYSINYNKVTELFMSTYPSMSRRVNVVMPERQQKQAIITPMLNEYYFNLVNGIFKHYMNANTQAVIVRTFLAVDQNLYRPGQKIKMKAESMSQEIETVGFDDSTQKQKLKTVLRGFPVPEDLLSKL